MSEPTVSASPPPPLALVELLSSLLLPQPATTTEIDTYEENREERGEPGLADQTCLRSKG